MILKILKNQTFYKPPFFLFLDYVILTLPYFLILISEATKRVHLTHEGYFVSGVEITRKKLPILLVFYIFVILMVKSLINKVRIK